MTAINSIVTYFWELEATTWELEPGTFSWSIGQNRFLDYMTPAEREESAAVQKDYKAKLKRAIADLVGGPRGPVYVGSLEKWISVDPWSSKVWSKDKDNQDWKTWK
jgi:hypothetical protein